MIKKILITTLVLSPIFAIAQTGVMTARAELRTGQTKTMATSTEPWAPKGQCIVAAIDVRENMLIANQTGYSTTVTNALNTRKDALRTAWLIESRTDRLLARAAIWKKFRESQSANRKSYDANNKTAWSNFRTAEKACKVDTGEAPISVTNTTTI